MAKKRPNREGEPTVAPADAKPKPRTGRQMIAFEPELYAQLQKLARKNRRPLQWEVAIICEEALKQAGLWPPPPDA